MALFEVFLWLVYGMISLNTCLNVISLIRSRRIPPRNHLPLVSILIPARNEERNIGRLLDSLSIQDHPSFECLIYDDDSEDGTWEVLSSNNDARIRALKGGDLPSGWQGKNHACYQLAKEAKGQVFLFLDADTQFLQPGSLRILCERFNSRGPASVITCIPDLRGKGRLVATMVGTVILGGMPWWLKSRIPFSLLSGVNGQCWMINRDDYERLTPHSVVRGEVLEDIMIGRYLHKNGIVPQLIDAKKELAVHMYDSFMESWRGFQKNAAAVMGPGLFVSLAVLILFTLLFVVAPIFYPFLILVLLVVKLLTDWAMGQPPWLVLFTPVSYILAILIGLDSIVKRARGTTSWKGRIVDNV